MHTPCHKNSLNRTIMTHAELLSSQGIFLSNILRSKHFLSLWILAHTVASKLHEQFELHLEEGFLSQIYCVAPQVAPKQVLPSISYRQIAKFHPPPKRKPKKILLDSIIKLIPRPFRVLDESDDPATPFKPEGTVWR